MCTTGEMYDLTFRRFWNPWCNDKKAQKMFSFLSFFFFYFRDCFLNLFCIIFSHCDYKKSPQCKLRKTITGKKCFTKKCTLKSENFLKMKITVIYVLTS